MSKVIVTDPLENENYMNRQIFIFSIIDTWTANDVIKKLLALDRESNEEITIFINSVGGSVTQMFAIIDTMRIIKSPIRTVVMGMAASAAAVIASSGDMRLISPTSEIMIHEAWGGAFGSVSEMREAIDHSSKMQDILIEILARNTKRAPDEIREIINKTDKYFSAQEAISFGLVDRIISDNEAQVLKLSEHVNVEGFEISDTSSKEIQLLREGRYDHPIYGIVSITQKIMELMKTNFEGNVCGQEISIDYTHDNENGESPAAFWVKSLEIKDNADGDGKGLFARGEYTPKGEEKIAGKEYRYSSADFAVDYIDQSGKHYPYVLRGGTLTNRPFIKGMNPIKLSEKTKSTKKELHNMKKDELIAELKSHGIDVSGLLAQAETLNSRIKELESKITELNALPAQKEAEIKALKDQLEQINQQVVDSQKLAVFNDLVTEGKCIPAQKDGIMGQFKTAEDITAFYKDAPKIVKTKADGQNSVDDLEGLSESEAALVQSGEYSREEIIEARKPLKPKAE